jgi:SAM-dependent methyltransferase
VERRRRALEGLAVTAASFWPGGLVQDPSTAEQSRCRACRAPLSRTFVDLGVTPLANSYLSESDLHRPEPVYPLHARVCDNCLLVQIDAVVTPSDLFDDYAYFSSYSDSWVSHARAFAESAQRRFDLTSASRVVEIASNDGYLLQHFDRARIPVLGIEPAANVARVAIDRGIPTEVRFFGVETAVHLRSRDIAADLLVANNVLAHVPDLADFVAGLRILLADGGVLSIEFPHLLRLIEGVQFDTIYHEHFSYFSLLSAQRVLAAHGLRVFAVDQLTTHGGSLRLLACQQASDRPTDPSVDAVLEAEAAAGMLDPATYEAFGRRVEDCRAALLAFVHEGREAGRSMVGYGAAAKGNTLLNYLGVGSEDLAYVVDRSPHKQGRYLPGTRIPIVPPERLTETRPDVVLVLAWNLIDEVMDQHRYVRGWGGRFAVPIPSPRIVA